MTKDKATIKEEIEEFKTTYGGDYSDYYIGITKHINQRLVEGNETIKEHLAKGEFTKGNPTYSDECLNREVAVEIEHEFQAKGMLKYNPRSVGKEDSKFIYCYKMTEENKKIVLSKASSEGKKTRKFIKKFKDMNFE